MICTYCMTFIVITVARLLETSNAVPQMRISVIISIIMLLKVYLKFAYGISEE